MDVCRSVLPEEAVNPFERQILGSLSQPLWSPTTFQNVHMGETPPQQNWTVDQMANLFPKPIEDSPSSHTNAYPVDPVTEAKAQADIDMFFSNGPIVPSPDETVPRPRGLLQMNREESEDGVCNEMRADKWTNTLISLPSRLPADLEVALAPYLLNTNASQSGTGVDFTNTGLKDDLNTSRTSVRRRLDLSFGENFYQDESSSSSFEENIPYGDPFRDNHRVSTPRSSYKRVSSAALNEFSTPELECKFRRCEFSPSGVESKLMTPNITPIGMEGCSLSSKSSGRRQESCIDHTRTPNITPITGNNPGIRNRFEPCTSDTQINPRLRGRGLKRKTQMAHIN